MHLSALIEKVETPLYSFNMADSKVRVVSMDALVRIATAVVTVLAIPLIMWMLAEILSLRDRTSKTELSSSYLQIRFGELRGELIEINQGIKELHKEMKK